MTPCRPAASISLRLAARPKSLDLPQVSAITAPMPLQSSPSAPARNAPMASGARTISTRAGSIPNSSSPAAWISPASMAEKSCRTHRSHFLGASARRAKASAKPDAAGASRGAAGNTSCSTPGRRPPARQVSAAAWPRGMPGRAESPPNMHGNELLTEADRPICSLFVPVCPASIPSQREYGARPVAHAAGKVRDGAAHVI